MNEIQIENFWKKVNIKEKDECWEWVASLRNGYGVFKVNGKSKSAHRLSYLLYYKEDPNKLFVCHKCDNRLCVEINHLFIGTYQDNINDMVNKERGRQHGKPNLTKEQRKSIVKMAESGLKYKDIAELFRITRTTVSNICVPNGIKKFKYLTASDKKLMFEMAKAGVLQNEIAKSLGVTQTCVSKNAISLGIRRHKTATNRRAIHENR